jgi:hypothetical protein
MHDTCAICEVAGIDTTGIVPGVWNADRDGLPSRSIYLCAECAEEVERDDEARSQAVRAALEIE